MGALVRCPMCGLKVELDGKLLSTHDGWAEGECMASRMTPGEAMDWLRKTEPDRAI